MKSAYVYKIDKIGYLIHAEARTKSGFRIAHNPYYQVPNEKEQSELVPKILSALIVDDSDRVPDPKDWDLYYAEVVQNLNLKNMNVLVKKGVKLCSIHLDRGSLTIIPYEQKAILKNGFEPLKQDKFTVSATANNEDVLMIVRAAFDKCLSTNKRE